MRDKKLDGFQFKLGLAILTSMGLSKLNNITPEYLQGAMQNAQSEQMQNIAHFFYNLATNPLTSFLFNTPHLEILPENAYGFKVAFMLINFIITYTPVFLLLFILIPKIFNRKNKPVKAQSIEDERQFPNYYDPKRENNKSFFTRLKFFKEGVKLSFRFAFLED